METGDEPTFTNPLNIAALVFLIIIITLIIK